LVNEAKGDLEKDCMVFIILCQATTIPADVRQLGNTINVASGVAMWAGNDSRRVKVGDVGHDEEDLAGRGTGGGVVGDNWRG